MTETLPQNMVLQSGDVSINHVAIWVTDGVIADSGVTVVPETGPTNFATNSKSGLPTASDISAGTWGVWKNTVDSKVYVAANDGGTIKKVELT